MIEFYFDDERDETSLEIINSLLSS